MGRYGQMWANMAPINYVFNYMIIIYLLNLMGNLMCSAPLHLICMFIMFCMDLPYFYGCEGSPLHTTFHMCYYNYRIYIIPGSLEFIVRRASRIYFRPNKLFYLSSLFAVIYVALNNFSVRFTS